MAWRRSRDIKSIAIGSDHSGVALKATLRDHLRQRGLSVLDVGTDGPDPVDYPDIAAQVGAPGGAQGSGRRDRDRRRRHWLGDRRQQDRRRARGDVHRQDAGALFARAQRRQRAGAGRDARVRGRRQGDRRHVARARRWARRVIFAGSPRFARWRRCSDRLSAGDRADSRGAGAGPARWRRRAAAAMASRRNAVPIGCST